LVVILAQKNQQQLFLGCCFVFTRFIPLSVVIVKRLLHFGYSKVISDLVVFYFESNENNLFALKNRDCTNTIDSCIKAVLSKFWMELVILVIHHFN